MDREFHAKKLLDAVQGMHDREELKEIVDHGCVTGTSLIYYNQTCKFYDEHEEAIWNLLYFDSEQFGLSILEFIATLNGSKDIGGIEQFKNLLCWYAIEHTARDILEESEEY